MYSFTLPAGVIVKINEKEYIHDGGGVFTGRTENDIPLVVDGVSPTENVRRFIPVFKVPPSDQRMCRVVYYGATEEVAVADSSGIFKDITALDFIPAALE